MKEQKEYKNILKVTALFGGVQVYQVLLSLVRTKLVAILLGVDGVGLLSLFNNTIGVLQSITGLGIAQGGVKSISAAANAKQSHQNACLVRKMSLYAGILGACCTLIFSKLLSQWTFGNSNYSLAFIWLSLAILFNILTQGELAIFQGLRKLRQLAKANLAGATVGLCVSIPIYYYWHVDGIAIALVLTSLLSYLAIFFFKDKMVKVDNKPSILGTESKQIMILGIMLTLSGIASTLTSYLFNIYLRGAGGLQDVGIYQAGFNIVDKYVGLIFVAMSTDYYPRLAAVHTENNQLQTILNQQVIVSLLLLCPIMVIFLPATPLIVHLLLTPDFLPVLPFLTWGILGMIFKVSSISLGYILIAKSDTKMYILSEMISWGTILVTHIIGYQLAGIEGIGIAFLVSYFSYLIMVYLICNRKYGIYFIKEVRLLLALLLITGILGFAITRWWIPLQAWSGYLASTLLILFTLFVCGKRLWKHLH